LLIREILKETTVIDEIRNDLMDFITMYRNKNIPVAPMTGPNGAETYMKKLNHDVTVNDIMKMLATPEFTDVVEQSGPENIKIKTGIPQPLSDKSAEKAQEKITKTADKAADDAVKSGELAT
jgi:hypothetical protein